ncbi:UNVERIFIED_CONTAM: hypothetical protein K2H54_001783 [Gekko kuhli]
MLTLSATLQLQQHSRRGDSGHSPNCQPSHPAASLPNYEIGPDHEEAPYFPKEDRRRARKWDSGVPASLSGASSLVAGIEDGSGPYWHDIVQEEGGRASPVEIEVQIKGSGARSGDEEEDDPWTSMP